MQNHEYADLFPMMNATEYAGLKGSIEKDGQQDAIWTYQDTILDGRNRYKACMELGVEPVLKEYEGTDPLGLVTRSNLHRRQLESGQRAMIAAKLADIENSDFVGNQHSASLQSPKISQSAAADQLNVSTRSVATAKKIEKEGTEELSQAVMDGKVSLSQASKIAELSEQEQRDIVQQDKAEIREAVKPQKPSRSEASQDLYDTVKWYKKKIQPVGILLSGLVKQWSPEMQAELKGTIPFFGKWLNDESIITVEPEEHQEEHPEEQEDHNNHDEIESHELTEGEDQDVSDFLDSP